MLVSEVPSCRLVLGTSRLYIFWEVTTSWALVSSSKEKKIHIPCQTYFSDWSEAEDIIPPNGLYKVLHDLTDYFITIIVIIFLYLLLSHFIIKGDSKSLEIPLL